MFFNQLTEKGRKRTATNIVKSRHLQYTQYQLFITLMLQHVYCSCLLFIVYSDKCLTPISIINLHSPCAPPPPPPPPPPIFRKVSVLSYQKWQNMKILNIGMGSLRNSADPDQTVPRGHLDILLGWKPKL